MMGLQDSLDLLGSASAILIPAAVLRYLLRYLLVCGKWKNRAALCLVCISARNYSAWHSIRQPHVSIATVLKGCPAL